MVNISWLLLLQESKYFLQLKEFRRDVGLSMKGSKSLKVRQDTGQECKTVELKQLPLRREDSDFTEKRFPQWNVGDKRLSTWKKC